MRYHKWSQENYALLDENVERYGRTVGCKKTAEELYVSDSSALSMYYHRLKKLTKHGIPVTHPEKAEEAKKCLENNNGNERMDDFVSKTKKTAYTGKNIINDNIELIANRIRKRFMKKDNADVKTCIEDVADMLGLNPETIRRRFYSKCGYNNCSLHYDELFTKDEYERFVSPRYGFCQDKELELRIADFLKKRISENPNNLQEVFREAGKKFGMHPQSISSRWYGIKHKDGKDYSKCPSCRDNIGHLYSVVGSNSTVNGKNQAAPDVKNTKWVLTHLIDWIKGKKRK